MLLLLLAWLLPAGCFAASPARYGMNLPPVNYWTPGQIFIDQMKSASSWNLINAPAGTAIPFDADGLPTGFPDALPYYGGLTVMTAVEPGATYVVFYKAAKLARIQMNDATVVSHDIGKLTLAYKGTLPYQQLLIYKNDGTFPTDIHIIRQDRVAAYLAGEQFAPDMLAQLKGFSPLRAMDWLQTNGSPRSTMILDDTKGSYISGVPLDVVIALANRTGAAPWINLPHLISDDGARAVFARVKANLKAGIVPVFEYSNEMWNSAFTQTNWAWALTTPKPNDNLYWLGYRSGKLAIIGRSYGYKMALMGQFVTPFRFASIYSGWQGSGALDSDLSAIGAADYYTGNVNDWGKPIGLAFLTRFEAALAQPATATTAAKPEDTAAMNAVIGDILADVASFQPTWTGYHQQWGGFAKAHGVPYLTYEGANFHLDTLYFGATNQRMAAMVARVQMDPRAANIVSAGTDAFRAAGGDTETVYNWSSPPGTGGFFGVLGTPTLAMMQARIAASAPVTQVPANDNPTIAEMRAMVARIAAGLAALPQ